MLTIRKEQMAVLSRHSLQQFQSKIQSHVAKVMERRGRHADTSEAAIKEGLRLARDFHLRAASDISRFFEILYVYFGGVPKSQLPRTALCNLLTYGVDSKKKLDVFEQWARQQRQNG